MPVQCTCCVCGATFFRKQSHINRATRNFCSMECRRTIGPRPCENCGTIFMPKGGAPGIFCSVQCSNEGRHKRAQALTYTCQQCGTAYHRPIGSAGSFCSVACFRASQESVVAFWRMVDTTGECWMWRGSTMTGGYGKTHFNGKRLGAHRRAYMLTYGDIPEGMHVCHRCDEPGCVRPEHLFLGTPTDNARDMVAKNRANPPRGSRSGKTHFTEDDVREIRRRYAAGDISQAHLARAFGVAPTTIRQIVTRRRWAHLD